MADNKEKIYKETRGLFFGDCNKAYCEIEETTSWPDGLHESSRFLPHLARPVRRTDSVDDIERYKLYFTLARKNQRNQLTWKRYCDLLLTNLRNSEILAPLKKLPNHSSCSPVKLKSLKNTAVARSVSSLKKIFESNAWKKGPFINYDADVESVSSVSVDDAKYDYTSKYAQKMPIQSEWTPVKQETANGPKADRSHFVVKSLEKHASHKRPFFGSDADLTDVECHTPPKNVLKKMCSEIRTLAQRTCKTVEKMTTNKYCSTCGDIIRSTTVHKKCFKQRIGKTGYTKPVTPAGVFNSIYPVTKRRLSFRSPTIKSNNVYLMDEHFNKLPQKPMFRL